MRNNKDFQERYERWKNGENYWDIRGVNLPKYSDANKYTVTKNDGTVFEIHPSAVDSHNITVTTPEIQVVGKAPRFNSKNSAFNGTELTDIVDKTIYNTIGKVINPLIKVPGVLPILRTVTPSNWIGTVRTGIAPWSEQNPGFGTDEQSRALNSLFNYGLAISPLKINAGLKFNPGNVWQNLKYSKLGERVRGIKATDEVYHGSKLPFNISKACISNPNTGDSGFHVGDNIEPALFMANRDFGGVIYKGKLQLKEPAFEVSDFGRWDPYLFWSYAKEHKEFAEYLRKHGINYEDFGDMSSNMSKGVQLLADKINNSGIALKYKNEYETLTGKGYSYYLSNPKLAHFTEVKSFGNSNNRKLFINPFEHVKTTSISDLIDGIKWQPYKSTMLKYDNHFILTPNFYNTYDEQ